MSAPEQTIIDLQTELDTLADDIETVSIDANATTDAIAQINDQMETRRAAFMAQILNERFTVNNKLVYTNDDQRKVRLVEMENADADFQALKAQRAQLATTSATQKAELEKNRNLNKTRQLVLQYYANLT